MNGPRYLTVREVAELARCEHKAVRRAILSGRLTAFRAAAKLLIREEDARAWIEAQPALAVQTVPSPRRAGTKRSSQIASVAQLRDIQRQTRASRS